MAVAATGLDRRARRPKTNAMVVLIADPEGVPGPAYEFDNNGPTVTVLAASHSVSLSGAWDLTCKIGNSLSSECITDAERFGAAFKELLHEAGGHA
jgi:hypothetical protein